MSDPSAKIPLVLVGARSFTAGELLRLLVGHPRLVPGVVVSRSASGAPLEELQPHLAGCFPGLRSGDDAAAEALLHERPDAAVALCVGNGEAAPLVARLEAAGLLGERLLVDLSGDFRLDDAGEYRRWYGREHPAPQWLGKFDYCIPELHRERCRARLVSNPGCFATAVQLALAPALRAALVEPDLRVFAVTGSSGSGAVPKEHTHHPTRAHEFYAYRPLIHQHLPEIRRGLDLDAAVGLDLITHSAPLVRGIFVTASLRLRPGVKEEHFAGAYQAFAAAEPMVEFVDTAPRLAGIVGTNRVRLAVAVEGRSAVAFCTLDNLTRGASGQALQNLNRVLGLAETLGLEAPGMSPA